VEVEFDAPQGAILITIDYMRRENRAQSRLEIVL